VCSSDLLDKRGRKLALSLENGSLDFR